MVEQVVGHCLPILFKKKFLIFFPIYHLDGYGLVKGRKPKLDVMQTLNDIQFLLTQLKS